MPTLDRLRDLHCMIRLLLGVDKRLPLEKPHVIQFPVNDICNSSCQMCNVWQKKLDSQLSTDDLAGILSNRLFDEVSDVGLNGGEPTLRKDLPEIVRVLVACLPKLRAISLITNALQAESVIAQIDEVGAVLQGSGKIFSVMVSLDGVGGVHDRVRGRAGSFENAVRVVEHCLGSAAVGRLHLGCTVIRENVFGLHDLLDFAIQKGVHIKFRLGIPHQRLYADELTEPFALSPAERLHFGMFLEGVIRQYETSEIQKFFYRSLVDQLLNDSLRKAGCDWRHRGVTLTSRGELLYCAVASKVLGSAINEDSEGLYFQNEDQLEEIASKKCPGCVHDYMGIPPVKVFIKQALQTVCNRFNFPLTTDHQKRVFMTYDRVAGRMRFSRRQQKFQSIKGKSLDSLSCPPAGMGPGNKRVMVVGWYGTETLGDKAILGGVVDALRTHFGELVVELVSLDPIISRNTVEQMPELGPVKVVTLEQALSELNEIDLLVFGGGPLMAIDSLAEMHAAFARAQQLGVPRILAGCGVGPLGKQYHNDAVRDLLQMSDARIYRDAESREKAKGLNGLSEEDMVSEDPAFEWLRMGLAKLKNKKSVSGTKDSCRLLLGLRELPVEHYAAHLPVGQALALKKRFEQEVLSGLLELCRQYPYLELVPFPMCTNHHGGDDRWFLRRIIRQSPELKGRVDMTFLSGEIAPVAALAAFRDCDAVLAMRFHSLVFALAAELPVVAIDYTMGRGKVSSLADKYKVPCISIERLDRTLLVETLGEVVSGRQAGIVGPVPVFKKTLCEVLTDLKI